MTLADELRTHRAGLAEDAMRALYERHPEWLVRWGPAGRELATRDTAFHLEFLEAALRSDAPAVFTRYTSWLAGILRARNVPAATIVESYDILSSLLAARVGSEQAAPAQALLAAGARATEDPRPVIGAGGDEPHPEVRLLVDGLVRGARADVARIISTALASGMGVAEIGDRLVQPAMTEIGRLWQDNVITVADEHLATALLQVALARGFAAATPRSAGRGIALFACVEGNHHAVGARIVADAYELEGWTVHFLGADVPTRDLVAAVKARAPELVGLSLALPQHVLSARRAIDQLREATAPQPPRIVIGGLPVREYEQVATIVGADAWFATARASMGPP